MPRAKSVKAIIAEVVMYVGMFAVVGHLSQNLYERYMLQSELSDMKTDLNSLELIIHNIGLAYDTLREDIQEMFANRESGKPVYSELKAPNFRPAYDSYLLHKSKHCTKCLPERHDVETNIDKCTRDFMQNFKRSTNNFMQYWRSPSNDETTLTENLVKCINVGVNKDKDNEIKDFCKCIVKCISHKDDTYKLVNLFNTDMCLSQLDEHVTANETNSNHTRNKFQNYKTL